MIKGGVQRVEIALEWGTLRLRTLALATANDKDVVGVSVEAAGKQTLANHSTSDHRLTITLDEDFELAADQKIRFEVALK